MSVSRFLLAGTALLLLVASFGARAASVAEEVKLKAAFVYNFSLFTTWPNMNHTLRICVLGGGTFVPLLKKYEGRQVQDAVVRVDQVLSAKEARACQVLFIDSSEHERIDSIVKELEGSPVLTVADYGKPSSNPVMILLTQDNDRFAFEVHQTAATAAGLSFSFKLLKLARKVY